MHVCVTLPAITRRVTHWQLGLLLWDEVRGSDADDASGALVQLTMHGTMNSHPRRTVATSWSGERARWAVRAATMSV
jgi:hypothetical protein